MEDKDKIIAELKADIKELGSIIECKNGTIATLAKTRDKLKAENATYKANADAVHKYITQNEQLKTHIDGLEKKNAELKAYKDVNEDFKTAWEELKAENARLYEEKNCLHKIIDRLLDNAGYSKDIASAEDFEDVYENMQYNRQKLSEYKQTLQEIKAIAEELLEKGLEPQSVEHQLRLKGKRELASIILDLITKAESEEE